MIISFGLGFAVGIIAGAVGAVCTLVVMAVQDERIKKEEETYEDDK